MALCDQLEASLTDTAATRRCLLAEALAPETMHEEAAYVDDGMTAEPKILCFLGLLEF